MKKIKYILAASVFLLIPLIFSSCSSWTFIRYIYENDRVKYNAEDFLPDGFASYDKVSYDHDKRILLWFVTDTMTVKVKYDDFYISKKHEVEQIYKFLTEPIEADMLEGHYTVPVTEFEHKGFHFRVAAGGDYPKEFGIVGYNDETKEIAYLWFHNPDRDCISEPDEDRETAMKEFIDEHFDL